MVRTPHFHCHGLSSIPGQGTKIPSSGAGQPKKEKKKIAVVEREIMVPFPSVATPVSPGHRHKTVHGSVVVCSRQYEQATTACSNSERVSQTSC